MAFDYKKEYKEYYMPSKKPGIVTIPAMNYIAVRGQGDPNKEDGEYKRCVGLLYGIAFTIKMSYKGTHKIDGYFSYVVPPLEGLWWQEDGKSLDLTHKEEGQCVQCMYVGSYDDESAAIQMMDAFAIENGYQIDFTSGRYHHEIYLSDPRRTAPEKCKTVIRHPVRPE